MIAGRKFYLVVLFLSLTFALWGPKVGGYFDLMIAVPALSLLVMVFMNMPLEVPRGSFSIIALFATCIFLWVSFCIYINASSDLQSILRSMRGVMTSLILFPLFYVASRNQLLSLKTAFIFLVSALLINVLVIYVQGLYLPAQNAMADLWGFDKRIVLGRAFGLSSGYDTSGYLAALTSAAAIGASIALRSWFWLAIATFAAGAVALTSRSSMMLLSLFAILALFLTVAHWRANRLRIVIIIAAGVFSGLSFVVPRLSSGIEELSWLSAQYNSDYSGVYADTSLLEILKKMAVLPNNSWIWIFGEGAQANWSDIGYIKILYLGGVPLLLLMIFFYGLLFQVGRSALHRLKLDGLYEPTDLLWIRVWFVTLSLTLLLMLLGNLKNLYFFSRGYHELFIVLAAVMIGFGARDKNRGCSASVSTSGKSQ